MLVSMNEEKDRILEAHEKIEKDFKNIRDKYSKLGIVYKIKYWNTIFIFQLN